MTNKDIYQLYAETLDLQARLCQEESRKTLSALPEFTDAKNILEVGCGGGAQVAVLKDLLQGKNYLGIDLSPELLAHAQPHSSQNISFKQQNILDFSPDAPFDFVLCFAVLQHLPDVSVALKKFATLVKTGSAIAIFDANGEEEFVSHPDLPELRKMYQGISEEKTGGKRKSQCTKQATELAPTLGFEVLLEKASNDKVKKSEHDLFIQYIQNVTLLVARKYDYQINQIEFDKELKFWREDKNSWVKLTGGSWLALKKF